MIDGVLKDKGFRMEIGNPWAKSKDSLEFHENKLIVQYFNISNGNNKGRKVYKEMNKIVSD